MNFPNFVRIAIVTNVGIFEYSKSREDGRIKITGGLEKKFLQALSEALNFTYEVHVSNDSEWGRHLGNGRWSGVIGMVARNEVDIGIGKIGIDYDRCTVTDCSYPYAIERITFGTAPPGVRSKETAIFYPFTKDVWITISLTAVFVVFVFRLIFRKYNYRRIIWYIYGTLLNCSGNVKSKKLRERILNSAWLLSSMILAYSFSAVLLSFITVPQKEPAISDKGKLLAAVEKGRYKCLTLRGSSLLRTLQTSTDEQVVSLAKHIAKNDWLIPPNLKTISRTLLQRNTAVISAESNMHMQPPESVFLAPDYFNLLNFGMVFNKNFCCKSTVDSFLHRFVAGGLYHKVHSDVEFRLQLKNRKHVSFRSDFSPLTLEDVRGAFVILACGYCLSFVALIVELLIPYARFHQLKSKSVRNRFKIK